MEYLAAALVLAVVGVLQRRYDQRDARVTARTDRANLRVEELVQQNPEASWREVEALLRAEHLM